MCSSFWCANVDTLYDRFDVSPFNPSILNYWNPLNHPNLCATKFPHKIHVTRACPNIGYIPQNMDKDGMFYINHWNIAIWDHVLSSFSSFSYIFLMKMVIWGLKQRISCCDPWKKLPCYARPTWSSTPWASAVASRPWAVDGSGLWPWSCWGRITRIPWVATAPSWPVAANGGASSSCCAARGKFDDFFLGGIGMVKMMLAATCFSIAWYHGETLTWLCIDLVNQFWRQLWENGDKILAFVFSIVANVTKKWTLLLGHVHESQVGCLV